MSESDNSSTYTIWALMSTGDYRKIRTFDNETLCEKYLHYVQYFYELYDNEEGVEELYMKKDGEPCYQLFSIDEEGNPELVENVRLYFNLEEIQDEINDLMADNQDIIYDYSEVDIEEGAETLYIANL